MYKIQHSILYYTILYIPRYYTIQYSALCVYVYMYSLSVRHDYIFPLVSSRVCMRALVVSHAMHLSPSFLSSVIYISLFLSIYLSIHQYLALIPVSLLFCSSNIMYAFSSFSSSIFFRFLFLPPHTSYPIFPLQSNTLRACSPFVLYNPTPFY